MTLPIQPRCDDKSSLPLRTGIGKRRPTCLSAAWADPPLTRKERRRAIYSWSVGYGTLAEAEENPTTLDSSINKGNAYIILYYIIVNTIHYYVIHIQQTLHTSRLQIRANL